MKNIGYYVFTANLLQSEKLGFLQKGCKPVVMWCQKRDLNSRPPAYEDRDCFFLNIGEILSEKTNNNLKILYSSYLSNLNQKLKINIKEINASLRLYTSSIYRVFVDFYCKLTANFFINNKITIFLSCLTCLIYCLSVLLAFEPKKSLFYRVYNSLSQCLSSFCTILYFIFYLFYLFFIFFIYFIIKKVRQKRQQIESYRKKGISMSQKRKSN